MQEISLSEMLKSGVHFGHRKSKKHPKMSPYIFDVRQSICILDLEKTKEKLQEALKVVKELSAQGKIILFVGTKRQAKDIVKKCAIECGMPYLVERWIGGLFTNFSNVIRLSQKLTRLKRDRDTGNLSKYTKKEQLNFLREITKLEKNVGGIEKMTRLPDAIFIVDIKEEKTAVREAKRRKVPLIAIVDTISNPELIDYPIPANDDGIKSINYIVKMIAETIKDNKKVIEKTTIEKKA